VTVTAQVEADGGLGITVADTGIGMLREDIPRAFEAFRQIDNALGRRYEGTGLGLPLARALVERHGGTLDLESTLGAGTTVTARFPASRVRRPSRS
jgi:signal transduction histidine kinase